ncbi:Hypothetical_protein [Hexamita inflata]|uniref:Hypothetical_protein n=1 Tax=Hexamita inflata TaxID=28002 RepID=A0AA86QP71_9EUKA|nr:Hypothetical protein HINF_LOCUS50899 [Hexamita inflata]
MEEYIQQLLSKSVLQPNDVHTEGLKNIITKGCTFKKTLKIEQDLIIPQIVQTLEICQTENQKTIKKLKNELNNIYEENQMQVAQQSKTDCTIVNLLLQLGLDETGNNTERLQRISDYYSQSYDKINVARATREKDFDYLEVKSKTLEVQNTQLQHKISQLANSSTLKIQTKEEEINTLTKTIDTLQHQIDDLKLQLNKLLEQNTFLETEATNAKEETKKVVAQFTKQQDSVQSTQDQIYKQYLELDAKQKEIDDQKILLEKKDQEIVFAKADQELAQQKMQQVQQITTQLTATIQQNTIEIKQLSTENANLKSELKKLQDTIKQNEVQSTKYQEQISKLEQQLGLQNFSSSASDQNQMLEYTQTLLQNSTMNPNSHFAVQFRSLVHKTVMFKRQKPVVDADNIIAEIVQMLEKCEDETKKTEERLVQDVELLQNENQKLITFQSKTDCSLVSIQEQLGLEKDKDWSDISVVIHDLQVDTKEKADKIIELNKQISAHKQQYVNLQGQMEEIETHAKESYYIIVNDEKQKWSDMASLLDIPIEEQAECNEAIRVHVLKQSKQIEELETIQKQQSSEISARKDSYKKVEEEKEHIEQLLMQKAKELDEALRLSQVQREKSWQQIQDGEQVSKEQSQKITKLEDDLKQQKKLVVYLYRKLKL